MAWRGFFGFIIIIIPVPSAQPFIGKPLIGEEFVVFCVWSGMGWDDLALRHLLLTVKPTRPGSVHPGYSRSIGARFGKCLLHPQDISEGTGSSVRAREFSLWS